MSTPMWDVPEHMMIPVTVNGEGPAEGDDFHHLECWCGNPKCEIELRELRDLRNQLARTQLLHDPVEIADRLEDLRTGEPHMDGSVTAFWSKYPDRPGQIASTLPPPVLFVLGRAIDALRDFAEGS